MNKKEIFKKVGGIIIELNEQYEYLSKSGDNLNELELELFAANANFLSDHIAVLVKLNENSKKSVSTGAETDIKSQGSSDDIPLPVEDQKPPASPKEVDIPDWKFELDKEGDKSFQAESGLSDKEADEILSEDENKRIDEETKLKPEAEKKKGISDDPVIKEVVISERTIAIPVEQPLTENSAPTINDVLSKQSLHNTIASQFSKNQVRDLKGMISLNDKLLFVRDLFNGYNLAYSEAIELLNRFDRIESADNFLRQNYALKNKWAEKQPVVDKFYEILNERFK